MMVHSSFTAIARAMQAETSFRTHNHIPPRRPLHPRRFRLDQSLKSTAQYAESLTKALQAKRLCHLANF